MIPKLKDILSATHPWGSQRFAQNLSTKAIPNDETLVLMGWTFWPGTRVEDSIFMSVTPQIVVPQNDELAIVLTPAGGGTTYVQSRMAGATQGVSIGQEAIRGNHLLVAICDRDNTLLEGWVDNSRRGSQALVKNPDFSGGSRSFMFFREAGGRKADGVIHRTILLTLANGSTPTKAEWAKILETMRHPQSLLHPQLKEIKGSVYSNYYGGEGIYGTNALIDQGDEGDDLAWQGAEYVTDVRTRTRVPITIPDKTFFHLLTGHSAAAPNHDYELLPSTPVIVRTIFKGQTSNQASRGMEIRNAIGGQYIRIGACYADTDPFIIILAGGAPSIPLPEDIRQKGADCIMVLIGSAAHLYFNGHKYITLNLVSAIDLSGNCQVNINDTGGTMSSCLFELYQMALPGGISDIEDAILHVTQNPEVTLGDVMGVTPKIHYPIRSDLIASDEDAILNQGDGGGASLVLDAVRSLSCQVAFTGHEDLQI